MDSYDSGQRQMAGSCELGNEPSGSIKCVEFLDLLMTCRLLQKGLLEGVTCYYVGMLGVGWTPSAVKMTCYNTTTKRVECESGVQMYGNLRQGFNVRDEVLRNCVISPVQGGRFRLLPYAASPTRSAVSSFPVACLQQRLINIQPCCHMTPCRLANSFRRFERYGALIFRSEQSRIKSTA